MRHVTAHTSMAANLYFTANRENLHSLPLLVDVAVEMGLRRIHVVDTVPFGANGPAASWATPARKVAMIDDAARQAAFGEFRQRCAAAGIEGRESLEAFRTTCHDPFNKIYVTWKGEVTPCCRIHTQVTVGDLRTTPLPAAWHGSALDEWRTRLWSGLPHELCRRFCNLPVAADAPPA
jgi:MoaA/NifB/PqqE/SkfB family radical SAM enzyme